MIPAAAPCPTPDIDQELTVLLEEKRRSMYMVAFRMMHSRDLAEDAVQEASLLAWRFRGTFVGSSKLFTWVIRILQNVCLVSWRRIKCRTRYSGHYDLSIDEMDIVGNDRSVEEIYAQSQYLAIMRVAITGLSPVVRSGIEIFLEDGERLDLARNTPTYKTRKKRAIGILRLRMEQKGLL